MNWKDAMGFVSTLTFLLPIIIIFALRLQRLKCFLALAIYYLLSFSSNLMAENYIHVSADFKRFFGIINNLMELPLIFTFMAYFSLSPLFAKRIRHAVLIFLLFEVIVTLILGFNKTSMIIIMAPGLSLILFFTIWFSLRQIKITITQGKSTGKALMISSLLFAYSCYALIYILFYLLKSQEISDIFVMYFFAGTLSTLVLSAGIMIENKRIKKLEELKITRKELSMIYGESSGEKTTSVKIAFIEKENWN
ncbi:MAG TPA: hypothetical protein VET23_09570 [Chitinophagaceae bacterium]|nr:hypothetical protein [Chitinophagaceae bacterium]